MQIFLICFKEDGKFCLWKYLIQIKSRVDCQRFNVRVIHCIVIASAVDGVRKT